jgi:acyl-CoA thioesterase-1
LAANDGLRALPVSHTRRNLLAMIQLCRGANARVLVLGIRLPPNYGVRYNNDFEKMFAGIKPEERVAVVPWFMRNVADRPQLMQPDGLHPNGQGQQPLLDNIWPALLKLLAGMRAKAA